MMTKIWKYCVMQIGMTKPRKLEDSGEPSLKNGPKILSIRPVQQANETSRFEVVSCFFEQFKGIPFSAISDEFLHAHSPKEPRVWKSAVFQRVHFSLSACLIFLVVGKASCA